MHSDVLKPILAGAVGLALLFTLRHMLVGSRDSGDSWPEPAPEIAAETSRKAPPPPTATIPPPRKPVSPRPVRTVHQQNERDDTLQSAPQSPGEIVDPSPQQAATSKAPSIPDEFAVPSSVDEANRMLQTILDAKQGNQHTAIEALGKAIAQMTMGRDEAVDAIFRLVGDDWLRRRFLNGYLYQLGHDDPIAALAFAEAVEEDLRINSTRSTSRLYGKSDAISAAVRGWAGANLDEARNWVEQLENGASRNVSLTALAQEWGVQDMGGALNWAEGLVESENARWLLTQVASRYASSDLAGALDYLSGIESGVTRDAYLQGIITRWAIDSPQDAMAAVDTTSTTSTAQNMARQVLHYWARKAPEEAMQWVEQSATEATYTRDVQAVVRAWAQGAPDDALAYATAVADEEQREQLTRTVVGAMGQSQPAQALQILVDLVDSPQRDSLEESILTQWARRDPQSTANWVAEMDETSKQHVATGNLMLQWGGKDVDAALAWTRRLPAGATRNAAILAIAAANQSFTDRQDLAAWQKLIRDPNLPTTTVTELLRDSALPADLQRTLQNSL